MAPNQGTERESKPDDQQIFEAKDLDGTNFMFYFNLGSYLEFVVVNGIRTPELGVFHLLEIPLYHGWMVDPQDSDTAKAFGSKPYNALLEEVANYHARNARGEEKNVLQEDCGDHQKGKGD
ncbi:hypothetical protein C5167_032238 [Papaver somniferum]|uniref:MINDY deubiquitinase domain-containing protein n=1 Tax=Papaver somniferum TaxID=3469 RepID=A0A4Y7KAW3_PAPSO|nr:hypothetical protein C5167_032238 [Papaver somniferum]